MIIFLVRQPQDRPVAVTSLPKGVPRMPKIVSRVCKLCAAVFDLEYSRGRPREYCFRCEPVGWKVVLPSHRFGRVKLRRVR